MDISEKYIKMCEKAFEIQRYYTNNEDKISANEGFCERSFFAENLKEEKFCPECGKSRDWDSNYCNVCGKKLIKTFKERTLFGEKDIWLPRQDQLQDMLDEHCAKDIITNLYYFSIINDNVPNNYSMEQILLVYVMKKRYNKIWDKEKEDWKTFVKKSEIV